MKNVFRVLLPLLTLVGAVVPAHGQLSVDLGIKRRIFMVHEPVIATIVLTNNSGRELTLADTAELQWFGFQITGTNDSIVSPRNPDYHLDPISLRPGETVKRSVNLNQLYSLGEFGLFRIRAAIYSDDFKKIFTSRPVSIELTEGRHISSQTVGVPSNQENGGKMHTFSLLKHQQGENTMLYVRVEDRDEGMIYGTYALGRLLEGVPPQAQFDAGNNFYVLQLIGQRAYVLSKIGVNGDFLGQTNYSAPKSRPTLRRLADGTLQIIGGKKEDAVAQNTAPTEPPAKLSDRPAGLPLK
jgi:hypothetical protein